MVADAPKGATRSRGGAAESIEGETQFAHYFWCLWHMFELVSIRRLSQIGNVRFGAKQFDKLIFVMVEVAFHYVHAWSKQTFKCQNVQNCVQQKMTLSLTHILV